MEVRFSTDASTQRDGFRLQYVANTSRYNEQDTGNSQASQQKSSGL